MRSNSDDPVRSGIQSRLAEYDTKDLLEIWYAADHEEWSDEAFEVIREILIKRLGEIPAREPEPVNDEPDPGAEETYHSPNKLLRIATWAETLSWVVLVLYLVNFAGRTISYIHAGFGTWPTSLDGLTYWLSALSTPLIGVIYFLILQAVSQGIYILMDIEENGLEQLAGKNR
jgi:hypothetical protein